MKKTNFSMAKMAAATIFCLMLASCELSINESNDCIKCYYDYNGGEISEEYCDPLITEEQKREVRVRMQMTADSLDVKLTCKES